MSSSPISDSISAYLHESRRVIAAMQPEPLRQCARLLEDAWSSRAQVFLLGNGGSASTASHMANDLSKATIVPGQPRMRVIALTDNVSLITAWANDESYDCVFKEQLENLLNEGDLVLAISASGNSPNVLRAMEFARERGAVTIGWTGQSGGCLKDLVDLCVQVPTEDVGMIESVHLVFDHLVTRAVTESIRARETAGDSLREHQASALGTAGPSRPM
jgi:D-sedoheptulose 7-phosphate isomerase